MIGRNHLKTLQAEINLWHMPYNIICRVIDTAASQLTKTAITVTTIFIVALEYDVWYYLLGHLGVTEYIYNSPKQKYGRY